MTKGALMLPAHNNQQKLLTQILQTSSSSSSSSSGTCWACRSCFEKQGPQGTAAAAVKHKSAVQCSLTAAEPQVVQASSSSSSHATSSVVARPAQAPAEHSAQAVHEAACFPALWRSSLLQLWHSHQHPTPHHHQPHRQFGELHAAHGRRHATSSSTPG
ncbi:hypothetical protein OEZ85_000270 [Tetradesmus obliquus]|uniref:Uncharacterized protein n=1 Tax=Tetradesmus obliquus TaxID=3088 RepID=A0ABY8URI7_TETOB|nr:hypothetical protein OEZ85_000270 [Tetradesmus obliquus]